jgi:hypothetical protein
VLERREIGIGLRDIGEADRDQQQQDHPALGDGKQLPHRRNAGDHGFSPF